MKRTNRLSRFIFAAVLGFTLTTVSSQAVGQGGGWTLTGGMTEARRDHRATLLANGRVFIIGGSAIPELYNPARGTFRSTTRPQFGHGKGLTATLLASGRVLVVGGRGASDSAEIFNPLTRSFRLTGSLSRARLNHSATRLPDGKVLIVGGRDPDNTETFADAEVFDPATGSFRLTGSLNQARFSHTATLLSSGQVLITGGEVLLTPGRARSLNSAELYDPMTGTFSLTGSMSRARNSHTATVLPDGRVLVAGASDGSNSVELYDPARGAFDLTGDMSQPRGGATATLLDNGQVLIAGGFVAAGPVTTSSAEVYDWVTGTFSPTGSMTTARQQHAATLLSDGRVLVSGGFDGNTNTPTAELYESVPPR